MTSEGGRGPDWWGRGVGLVVFFLGIALLIVVFFWTLALSKLIPTTEKVDLTALGIRLGVELGRLFVSGLVASWIAGRGAQLYGAANRALSGD
jgi:hypothetical protein